MEIWEMIYKYWSWWQKVIIYVGLLAIYKMSVIPRTFHHSKYDVPTESKNDIFLVFRKEIIYLSMMFIEITILLKQFRISGLGTLIVLYCMFWYSGYSWQSKTIWNFYALNFLASILLSFFEIKVLRWK